MPNHQQGRLAKIKAALSSWWSKYDLYLLAVLGNLGIAALVIGLGALFNWPLIVGFLLSGGLPLLTLGITLTAIGSVLVLVPLAYGARRLYQARQKEPFVSEEPFISEEPSISEEPFISASKSFKQLNQRAASEFKPTASHPKSATTSEPKPALVADIDLNPSAANTREYIKGRVLDKKGPLGVVFIGKYNPQGEYSDKPHVIKEFTDNEAAKRFSRKAKLMQALQHPHLVKIYGYYLDEAPYSIIMEYMAGGSLHGHLSKQKSLMLAHKQISIATHMIAGLSYLHHQQILHCNLKSTNILLDRQLCAKLADFGLAKTPGEIQAAKTALKAGKGDIGTLLWMAPELVKSASNSKAANQNIYSEKSDIYAYGLILWELATSSLPFNKGDRFAFLSAVENGTRKEPPKSSPLAGLIKQCWVQDNNARPTADQVHRSLLALTASP